MSWKFPYGFRGRERLAFAGRILPQKFYCGALFALTAG